MTQRTNYDRLIQKRHKAIHDSVQILDLGFAEATDSYEVKEAVLDAVNDFVSSLTERRRADHTVKVSDVSLPVFRYHLRRLIYRVSSLFGDHVFALACIANIRIESDWRPRANPSRKSSASGILQTLMTERGRIFDAVRIAEMKSVSSQVEQGVRDAFLEYKEEVERRTPLVRGLPGSPRDTLGEVAVDILMHAVDFAHFNVGNHFVARTVMPPTDVHVALALVHVHAWHQYWGNTRRLLNSEGFQGLKDPATFHSGPKKYRVEIAEDYLEGPNEDFLRDMAFEDSFVAESWEAEVPTGPDAHCVVPAGLPRLAFHFPGSDWRDDDE